MSSLSSANYWRVNGIWPSANRSLGLALGLVAFPLALQSNMESLIRNFCVGAIEMSERNQSNDVAGGLTLFLLFVAVVFSAILTALTTLYVMKIRKPIFEGDFLGVLWQGAKFTTYCTIALYYSSFILMNTIWAEYYPGSFLNKSYGNKISIISVLNVDAIWFFITSNLVIIAGYLIKTYVNKNYLEIKKITAAISAILFILLAWAYKNVVNMDLFVFGRDFYDFKGNMFVFEGFVGFYFLLVYLFIEFKRRDGEAFQAIDSFDLIKYVYDKIDKLLKHS